MIKKLRTRWNRFLNRKAIARYEFDRKMLSFLTEDEKERYAGPATAPGLPVYRPLRSEKLGATGDGIATADLKESLAKGGPDEKAAHNEAEVLREKGEHIKDHLVNELDDVD